MALTRGRNGRFQIKTLKQAKEAAQQAREYKAEIKEKMNDASDLAKEAALYLHGHDIREITMEDGDKVTVVQRFSRFWAGEDEEVEDIVGAQSLKSIVGDRVIQVPGKKAKKLWYAITRRVVDPTMIDHAVAKGWLDEDEIAPALIEKPQSPYLSGL